jgi:hypothetical protein
MANLEEEKSSSLIIVNHNGHDKLFVILDDEISDHARECFNLATEAEFADSEIMQIIDQNTYKKRRKGDENRSKTEEEWKERADLWDQACFMMIRDYKPLREGVSFNGLPFYGTRPINYSSFNSEEGSTDITHIHKWYIM